MWQSGLKHIFSRCRRDYRAYKGSKPDEPEELKAESRKLKGRDTT